MLRRYLRVQLLIWLLMGVAACRPAADPLESGVALEPCQLAGDVAAQCGVLTVFEDRTASSGRTIDLNIAVLPATSSNIAPDPLFLLAGGPGQAATETFPLLMTVFEDVNENRDIVLVDQRGTGKSNPIECANFADAELDVEPTDEEVAELVEECLAGLDADPTLYTTDIAMADLNDVREALGYETINLYGASYGTRAAMAYLRLYPEHVRTITLDAVTAPELVLFLQMPRDAQAALEMMLERCEADADCNRQFPELRLRLEELLASLGDGRPVSVVHPTSGEVIELTVTADLLMQTLFNALYSTDIVALLPLLIHQAAQTGDVAPLVAQALILSQETGIDYGLLYAVACTEDAPLISLEEAEAIQAETDFPLMADAFLQVCARWPRGQVSPALREPLQSDVPVLLLSGGADPVTPPRYAEAVAETLPNSLHLVAPDYGHGIISVGCVPRIFTSFIAAGTVADLDTTCLQQLQPPPFFMTPAGPKP